MQSMQPVLHVAMPDGALLRQHLTLLTRAALYRWLDLFFLAFLKRAMFILYFNGRATPWPMTISFD